MKKKAPTSLVEAVQVVFAALEPFDEQARQRILASAVSLLGSGVPSSQAAVVSIPARTAIQVRPTSDQRPLSPAELVAQKEPATNAQLIALFAYHREKYEGLPRFSRTDLRPYFAKARQTRPQNFDRDYNKAVKAGWIYDDGSESYLTSKGVEAVEAGFGGKRPYTTRGGSKAAKRRNRGLS